MATNKNAALRYKILDNCFRNTGRRYFIDDLIEECSKALQEIDPKSKGISRRQILDDIAFMESGEGWSIDLARHKDNKRVYYRYEDPKFSINNMPLNETEIRQLRNAVETLSRFKGMPQFEWVQELLPKLNQGISIAREETPIMDFDSNEYLKGIEHLGSLYNAIQYKKVLKVSYQPFENVAPYDVIIHPYYLKQYNNRWFLFGFNPELDKYDWNLALDRIIGINELSEKYRPNTEIDWNEYFDDIIGVTKPVGCPVEKIVLHFEGRTGKYMESKPLHNFQRTTWHSPNLLEVRIDLIVNYELKRFILSYGPSVKVVSPEWLKKDIAENLKHAYSQYLHNDLNNFKK